MTAELSSVSSSTRVQNLHPSLRVALYDYALRRRGSAHAIGQQLLDVLDYVTHLEASRASLRDSLRHANEQLGKLAHPDAATLPPAPATDDVPDEVDAVSIALGPTLLERVDALTRRGDLGDCRPNVAQTLFVLGLLDAEGMAPDEHVCDPVEHVSTGATFIRFALPHEDAARRTRIVRQLLVHIGDSLLEPADPLRLPLAAALAELRS